MTKYNDDHMYYLIRELKLRPVITGILSYIPGLFSWWDLQRPMGNTSSASYSRSIWRFHLENYKSVCGNSLPKTVAELGPGQTLGTCISALCDGVDRAIGLDACPYASGSDDNLRILDELLSNTEKNQNHDKLIHAVKNVYSNEHENSLKYVAPWGDITALPEASVDLIYSHSVMEHVNAPLSTYQACYRWLKPGGIMSHKIDHSSHAITKSWNGHYGIPRLLWTMISGKRPYLLNRMTSSQHQRQIESAGFKIVSKKFIEADETDNNSECHAVKNIVDFRIKTSTFVCQKPI